MPKRALQFYYLALLSGLVLHGVTLVFTFEGTYDAFVHLFFADHYAENWFETWDYKWYAGFTITSYPPLVHQVIALLSKVVGLKGGFLIWSFFIILVFIRGVFHFSRIWVDDRAAAYAAVLAVFSTSFGEALHIFGQLPSITGIALLLNACPELYYWLRYNQPHRLLTGLSLLAVTSTAHHVTTIFGMVFFVLPTLGLAVMNRCAARIGSEDDIHFKDIFTEVIRVLPRVIVFGILVILITVVVIFPYWYWSKSDPIAQVPIPHGSRDSYLEVLSSGLVFFLIPWGMMLFFLPFLFRELFRKRNIFLGLSITLAFLLGTGGTTPLPQMMLGETAFNILTLDRFTYWATLLALPFWGAFFFELIEGSYRDYLERRTGVFFHRFLVGTLVAGVVISALVVINFQNIRATQPAKIAIDPIVNFMARDKHHDWRYLTLGFGDQMAWLSANIDALSIDGNYHSVRRLPEMTSRAVERLENAKYLGMEGINSLQEFLTIPEKYRLKFIFSNDKFYDPLLFFAGWNKVQQLENNIVVWEKPDIPTLPSVLPRKNIPIYQRLMWGLIPVSCLILALVLNGWFSMRSFGQESSSRMATVLATKGQYWGVYTLWLLGLAVGIAGFSAYKGYQNLDQVSPQNVIDAYFNRLDFKDFPKAYTYFNPDTRPSLDQYLMELSLEGGILSSYAKLDALRTTYQKGDHPGELKAEIEASWLTALHYYQTKHTITLTQRGLFWYIEPFQLEKRTPPDQFVRIPAIDFFSQGKRKALADKVEKRDILDRPDFYILSAALVERSGQYAVIGEAINTDNDPGYLTLEAVMYNRQGQELARYNARDAISHMLYPKESTTFRVDFTALRPPVPVTDSVPHSFVVFARSMVAAEGYYKNTGLQQVRVDSNTQHMQGEVINYGARQIIVPQLLLSYYRPDRKLLWVEPLYLSGGIRPQRQKAFDHPLPDLGDIRVIQWGNDDNLRINGVPRQEYRQTLQIPLDVQRYPAAPFILKDDLWVNIKVIAQMAALSDES
ncbi:MAG: hypothetical protein H6555_13025 [Lewinellaceae bacterium]|nr:hypothetical protein [Lewinellaceae bacterium]